MVVRSDKLFILLSASDSFSSPFSSYPLYQLTNVCRLLGYPSSLMTLVACLQYLMYRSIAFCFSSLVYFAKTLFLLKKKSRILSAVPKGDYRLTLTGYLNLFCFISNPPCDKYEKIEKLLDLTFRNPKMLRYRG